MMQKMTCGAIALLATACLPISASAATLPETLTLAIPAGTTLTGTELSIPFNEFNPSLGTLTGVSATLTGSVLWTETNLEGAGASDFLRLNFFKPLVPFLDFSATQIFDTSSIGTLTEAVSLNAATSVTSDLSHFQGTTTSDLILELENGGGEATIGPVLDASGKPIDLSGTITFTYTPVATPLPAALPLFATGIGGLGLLGWRRKRKAKAVA